MNHFIAGILRIVLLEAGVALLVLGRVIAGDARVSGRRRRTRRLDVAFAALAALSLVAWTDFGALRNGGLVHRWEQYHFYFGSKYLREVGYADLYKATILADREGGRVLAGARRTRDLTTFDDVPIAQALGDASRVRASFTDARWAEFKRDWQTLSQNDTFWVDAIEDHGNSGSPAWAIFAAPIAAVAGISEAGQSLMAWLDLGLMAVLFAFVWRTFGVRASAVCIWIWCLVPFCFDFLAGSFLRWDWLFALGMCACFWQRKRPLVAGLFLGYAIASKLFPLFFGVGLGIKLFWDLVHAQRLGAGFAASVLRRIKRLGAGVILAALASVLVSSAMFGGSVWTRYAQRIEVAQHEKFYGNQYSFRTVFLQFAARSGAAEESVFTPSEVKQGRRDVDIRQYPLSYPACQLALTALLAVALVGADELEALAIGPFFVFIWLTVNAYYWNMLALPALAWAVREGKGRGALAPLILLHASLAGFYLYQHVNRGYAEGYVGGLAMLALTLTWAVSAWLRRAA